MKVSIIIPTRYRPDLTRVCLDSIIRYTENFELILVQEGDDEEITNLLKEYDGIFIQNKIPKGFAGAMNSGFKVATGDYVCFLNNDTVVTPNWMSEMLKLFEDTSVGMVTPSMTGTTAFQRIDFNRGQSVDYITDPLVLAGVCFVFSREALNKIGEWDESLGLGGGEDNDMCIRTIKAGYKMAVARKSLIYHYGMASFRELFNNDLKKCRDFAREQFQKLLNKYPDLEVSKKELNQ